MTIVISDNAVLMLVFITGLIIGAIAYRIITAPMNNQDRKDLEAMRIALDAFEMRSRPPPPKPDHNPNK